MHHDPQSLEALQAVGALYILMGDLNTGRHYLRRALERWEGTGSNLVKMMQVREGLSQDKMGHWLLDYLLSAFSLNSSWKERGG